MRRIDQNPKTWKPLTLNLVTAGQHGEQGRANPAPDESFVGPGVLQEARLQDCLRVSGAAVGCQGGP
jgi:hypothetical protein